MGDPRAVGAQIRMKLPSLTPLKGKVAADYLARTIAVTIYPESPLVKLVDVVLCSTAQNAPLLGENATARIAERDRNAADTNLSRTMRAVQSKRRL